MENIRTNKAARAAAMLLVLVLITMCILSGTLAKYITKDSGSDSARVAKFGVVASVSGNLFGKAYKYDGDKNNPETDTAAIATYAATKGLADGYVVQTSQENAKIVAPGTYNDKGMTISLKGKPEVATKLEATVETEDIYLKVGEYGVMVPVAASSVDPLNVGSYYTYNTSTKTYSVATEVPASGNLYTLQDQASVAENDYHPIEWSLNGDVTEFATLKSTLETKFKSGEHDPNYDYTTNAGAYTITWAWPFADDYGEGTPLTTSDRKDTILGDLIAKSVTPSENTHYDVVMAVEGGYTTVDVADKKATVGTGESKTEVANLGAKVDASLTVKQIIKKAPEPVAIGGKIFYATPNMPEDTKKLYKFYKDDGSEIATADWSVDGDGKVTGLDEAVGYISKAAAGAQNFYVVGLDGDGNLLRQKGNWGEKGTTIGINTNTIGAGKSNTKSLIEYYGTDETTIWSWIISLREAKTAGHADWFIGTKAEVSKLMNSGLYDPIEELWCTWTSVEYDEDNAVSWDESWTSDYKWSSNPVYRGLAFRTF